MINQERLNLITDWLKLAKENLLYAKVGLEQDFSPSHTVCFLCQSSAEKYLKAFLLWNNWTLKKTHDLLKLLIYCCDYDESFEILLSECSLLNEYITEGRYPGDLPFERIGEEEAKMAVNSVEQIEKFVIDKLQ